ncbi:two pore domain potassium channel family protein [Actinomyces lilanjuaniae]|uniref:Two pore domain potassium channel family protein n=1 Tax=Actinomyces lilanjuaniae TaxID=2321394 RepID=A0ABN5PT41_9ACTO|nr:potassium channel family protein [Actinomyces lilanjuaniae]AYD89946.1 two pore domain potassium channel family protein [Actinomyces lilanjuaniae]
MRRTRQQRTDLLLTLVAVAYLGLYSWEVVADLPPRIPEATSLAVSACFLGDYLVRLRAATHRWHWVTHHLLDLVVVVLPVLRPLRLLRLVMVLRVFHGTVGRALRGKVIVYAASGAVLLAWVGSLAVLEAERSVDGATITSLGDALWWSLVTMTTVGYGDIAPVTTTGRLVAMVFMITGVALIGAVTATLSSWIVERATDQEPQDQVPGEGSAPPVPSTRPKPPALQRPGPRRPMVPTNRVSVRRRGPGPARRRRQS